MKTTTDQTNFKTNTKQITTVPVKTNETPFAKLNVACIKLTCLKSNFYKIGKEERCTIWNYAVLRQEYFLSHLWWFRFLCKFIFMCFFFLSLFSSETDGRFNFPLMKWLIKYIEICSIVIIKKFTKYIFKIICLKTNTTKTCISKY